MTFSENEEQGIRDFFLNDENKIILIMLAKSLIKNTEVISTEEVALNTVLTLGKDAITLLSKKLITKELLYKYLTRHQIPVEQYATKSSLIAKILEHWKTSSRNSNNECDTAASISVPQPSPNVVASAFAEWFYSKYNSNDLQEIDFWPDSNLIMRVIADDATEESACQEAKDVVRLLQEKKLQFGFFFNLNTSNTGVQGRMDVHGMLLVLTCGTLHTRETCVGVFECMFGLLRDPYDCNNWKIKTVRFVLRSEGATNMPTLDESESLRDALAIPVQLNENS